MKIYNYDDNGEFLNEANATPDPLEKGKFLIPAKATKIKPLSGLKANETQVFKDGKWQKTADFRGTKIYNKETQEEYIQKELGEIADEWTTLVPKENQKWSANKWIDDTEKILNIKVAELNTERDNKLTSLTVEYEGNTYQADMRSIIAMQSKIFAKSASTTIEWITADNKVVSMKEAELSKILKLIDKTISDIRLEYNSKIKAL